MTTGSNVPGVPLKVNETMIKKIFSIQNRQSILNLLPVSMRPAERSGPVFANEQSQVTVWKKPEKQSPIVSLHLYFSNSGAR